MFAIRNFTIGKLLLYERASDGLVTRFVRQTYTVFTWCHMLLGVCMRAKDHHSHQNSDIHHCQMVVI